MEKILNNIKKDLNDVKSVLTLIKINELYGLSVSAKFVTAVNSLFSKGAKVNMYKVTIKKDGKRFYSSFYGSTYEYQSGTLQNESDWAFMLQCIANDGLYGLMSFDLFCAEFGYEPYETETKHIYRKCQETAAKFERLGIDEDELFDIVNLING